MKISDKDILRDLADLRENSYNVPDGYFDGLKTRLKMIPQQDVRRHRATHKVRSAWWWAAAVLLIAAGGFLAGLSIKSSYDNDYIVSSSSLTEDEIIEYLIYADVQIEEFEQY